MFSLPDEFLTRLRCHWPELASTATFVVLLCLCIWLIVRSSRWLTAWPAPARRSPATHWVQLGAGLSCGLLAALALALPWLVQFPDWDSALGPELKRPTPLLLALTWRWLALLPLLIWLLGLLRPVWRHSPAWSRNWARVGWLGLLLMLVVSRQGPSHLGCVV